MKSLFLTLSALLITVSASFAQLTQGHIEYTIEITTDNPDMEMAVSMFQGSKMNIYFKEDASRTEITMGSLMTNITITDFTTQNSILLMSGMMGNKAMILESSEEDMEDFEVVLLDESKEILGYECKKAILTNEDGLELFYWYTEDIAFQPKPNSNIELPGMPLQFQMAQSDMLMTMTASQLNKKFKETNGMFSTEVPEGYELTTPEELQGSFGK